VAALEVTYPFGCGARNPSGPAAVCRANRPDTRTLSHQIRNFGNNILDSVWSQS
jgi:hypothetical protein